MNDIKILFKLGSILLISMVISACGTNTQNGNSTQKAELEVTNDSQIDSESTEVKYEDEPFSLEETDVVNVAGEIRNLKILDQFVADSSNKINSEIRYVILENDLEPAEPLAVYQLKAVTDTNAGQSWVEIFRDWRYDNDEYDNFIETQQCSEITKDEERGAYYFNECFHRWEIELMPIPIEDE